MRPMFQVSSALHRAVGVTPNVAKTATGAIEHVPIARELPTSVKP